MPCGTPVHGSMRHSEGRLTHDELRELESLVRRNLQISELKAEAQKCLDPHSA